MAFHELDSNVFSSALRPLFGRCRGAALAREQRLAPDRRVDRRAAQARPHARFSEGPELPGSAEAVPAAGWARGRPDNRDRRAVFARAGPPNRTIGTAGRQTFPGARAAVPRMDGDRPSVRTWMLSSPYESTPGLARPVPDNTHHDRLRSLCRRPDSGRLIFRRSPQRRSSIAKP